MSFLKKNALEMKNRNLLYSGLFAIALLLVYYPFLSNGKLLMWEVDALEVHYAYFVYLGEWLRNIILSLVSEHRLVIPLWDYSIGYGADVLLSSIQIIVDPLNWISVFIPVHFSEYVFHILILLRMYLSGLAFLFYVKEKRVSDTGAVCGAVLYALSGYMLVSAKQVFFLNPMVFFPLLIREVEHAFTRRYPLGYTLCLAAVLINYFYFGYMMCILVFGYCILWFLSENPDRTLKCFFHLFLRFLLFSILSVLIAAVVLLPILLIMIVEPRLGLSRNIPLLYSLQGYQRLLSSFFSTKSFEYDVCIGLTPVCLFSVVLLFRDRGKNQLLKLAFLCMTVMLLIPWFGHLMNGMQYATNRWTWAYVLCLCLIAARYIDRLIAADKKTVLIIGAVLLVCIALIYTDLLHGDTFGGITAVLAVVFLTALYFTDPASKIRLPATTLFLIACIASCNGVVNLDHSLVDMGSAYSLLTEKHPARKLQNLDDAKNYRFDSNGLGLNENSNMLLEQMGFTFYQDIYNPFIDEFHRKMGCAGWTMAYNYKYNSLNYSPILDHLMGARYYIGSPVPFGYSPVRTETNTNEHASLYESDYEIPLAYLYHDSISYEQYENLSPFERRQLILDRIVIEMEEDKHESVVLFGEEVKCGSTITSFTSSKTEDSFVIETEPIEEGYCYYVFFRNLQCRTNGIREYLITVHLGETRRDFTCNTPELHMYGGKHDWLLCMGTPEAGTTECSISFNVPGTYTCDEIQVLRLPLDVLDSKLRDVESRGVSDLSLETNRVAANCEAHYGDYLFFSIPYSKGWSASVNGEKAVVLRANSGFCAVKLPEGKSYVELAYMTPGLREGAVVSLVGLAAYVICFICRRHEKRRKEPDGKEPVS